MTIKTKCLECDGEGYLEVVTGIAADGDQITAKMRCEACDGYGTIELTEQEAERMHEDAAAAIRLTEMEDPGISDARFSELMELQDDYEHKYGL